jgi:uncharacterized damage-inducible protein DinB
MSDPTGEIGLVEAWNAANRMTLLVLGALSAEALAARLDKGRTVGEMIAHLHNNRLAWLEHAGKDLMGSVAKLEGDQMTNAAALRSALEASGTAWAEVFRRAGETGKVKNFKRSPETFLGYLIAHEGYHQGEIGMVLAQAGHRLPKEVAYGIWEWGKI